MKAKPETFDPIPSSAYPSFQPVTNPAPSMPAAWTATVLLHPFSPPLSSDPTPDNPFFQLCVANIVYVQGQYFSAQVSGCSYGSWWYIITPDNVTQLSTDGGKTWSVIASGWLFPTNWYGAQAANAACAGAAPLNWMGAQNAQWWKIPVPQPTGPSAATWLWFDENTLAPVRAMFGSGPPSPTVGDPNQLAFFQMWSFSYFPVFQVHEAASEATARPKTFTAATFPGFAIGNPN